MTMSRRRRLRRINLEGAYSAEENARLILDERTSHLASRAAVESVPAVAKTPVLVCGARREFYGIALDAIAEVLPAHPCVPIPDGPAALVGLLGRGGNLVSVVDLGAALGASAGPADQTYQHFVLLKRNHPRIALRVERAHGVTLATPIAAENGQVFRNDAVTGYAEAEAETGPAGPTRVLSLLDVERLIRSFLPSSPNPGA